MLTPCPSFVLGVSQPNSTVLEFDISYHPTSAMAPACSPCFYPQHPDFPPTLPCHPPRVISQNANMVLSLPSLNPERAPTALRLDSETFTKGYGARPIGPRLTSSSWASPPGSPAPTTSGSQVPCHPPAHLLCTGSVSTQTATSSGTRSLTFSDTRTPGSCPQTSCALFLILCHGRLL